MQHSDFEYRNIVLAGLLLTIPLALLIIGPLAVRSLKWEQNAQQNGIEKREHFEHAIGSFAESNHQFANVPIQIELKLFAGVPKQQNNEFISVVAGRENHLRSAVSKVIRSARLQDLREPELATLKRKMKVALVTAYGAETSVFDNLIVPEFEAHQIN